MINKYVASIFTLHLLLLHKSYAMDPVSFLETLRKSEARLVAAELSSGGYACLHEFTSPPSIGKTAPDIVTSTASVARRQGAIILELGSASAARRSGPKSLTIAKSCIADGKHFAITGLSAHPVWNLVIFKRGDAEKSFHESLGLQAPIVYPLSIFTQTDSLHDIIKRKTFKVLAVRNRPDGNLEADYTVNTGEEDKYTLEGTLIASPSPDYSIIENNHVLSITRGYRIRMTREFGDSASPTRCTRLRFESTVIKTGEVKFKSDFQFNNFTADLPDKEIFTLEHYGIPTPDDDLVPWYSRWKVWAALAVSGLVLAVVFRRLAVRRRVR